MLQTCSLREGCNVILPGQVFDGQTGLHQNYFRDYDPATGRYVESDPIGLAGGSYSTYAYVGGNPITNWDPSGTGPIGTAIGGLLGGLGGGVVGGVLGAGGGTVVAPGVGTVAGGVGGAEEGATVDAVAGAVPGGYIGDQVSDAIDNIMHMSKGGSQNKANEYSRAAVAEAQASGKDSCDLLDEWYKEAKASDGKTVIVKYIE